MKLVRINQGKSLPTWLRVFIVIISILLMILAFLKLITPWSIMLAILFSLIPPAGWFATNILEINTSKKMIFQGSWSMGFRFGNWKHFQELKIIFEEKKIKTTSFTLPNNKLITTNKEYQAFLETETAEKIYLFGHPIKDRIKEKVETLNKKLRLDTKKDLLP